MWCRDVAEANADTAGSATSLKSQDLSILCSLQVNLNL